MLPSMVKLPLGKVSSSGVSSTLEHGRTGAVSNIDIVTCRRSFCPIRNGAFIVPRKRLTIEEFIERSRAIHGDKYDYSLVEFATVFEKVTISCPRHGNFFQVAQHHYLSGSGCPKCRGYDLSMEERFWEKVDSAGGPDACWIWTGGTHRNGYGNLRVGKKTIDAHRVSWELHNGPIPDGMCVCHSCPSGDNPSCVNPAHLWLGTKEDNNADRSAKGRTYRGTGENHFNAKLTWEKVRLIRHLRKNEQKKTSDLAVSFSVSTSTIKRILQNRIWTE